VVGYAVELYAPTEQRVGEDVDRVRAASEAMTSEGTPVRYVRSLLLCDDETCFLLFEAPSAEAVGEASRRAELSYVRIVEAVG
jgi:uncharacterized protein DUF4242